MDSAKTMQDSIKKTPLQQKHEDSGALRCLAKVHAQLRPWIVWSVCWRNASLLVGVLRYLVASHLRLLGLGLRTRHGVLMLPLRQVVEPRMLQGCRCGYAHLWA